MECDSVHSTIERELKKREIYVPADYLQLFRNARKKPEPYQVVYLDHTFFKDYTKLGGYNSIRPGTRVGDPVVTDIRALRYLPNATISFKTDFSSPWVLLPNRPKALTTLEAPSLYNSSIAIKVQKFSHCQELKAVIPTDHQSFYDNLKHECSGPCQHIKDK